MRAFAYDQIPSVMEPASNTGIPGFALPLLGTAIAGAFAYTYYNSLRMYQGLDTRPDGEDRVVYGKWRTDVPAVEGYSHELISVDSYTLVEQGRANLDTLETEPFPGVDTLYKAMQYNLKRLPNNDLLGWKAGKEYTWITWK